MPESDDLVTADVTLSPALVAVNGVTAIAMVDSAMLGVADMQIQLDTRDLTLVLLANCGCSIRVPLLSVIAHLAAHSPSTTH